MKQKEKTKKKPCSYIKFDGLWGEWKCLKKQVRLYPDKNLICRDCDECKTLVKPAKICKKRISSQVEN